MPVISSPVRNTQKTDTVHTETLREMGRLATEEEGDSEEEQRELTQRSSDGQGLANETHGTYLEALTGSTYSTVHSTASSSSSFPLSYGVQLFVAYSNLLLDIMYQRLLNFSKIRLSSTLITSFCSEDQYIHHHFICSLV